MDLVEGEILLVMISFPDKFIILYILYIMALFQSPNYELFQLGMLLFNILTPKSYLLSIYTSSFTYKIFYRFTSG